MNFVFAVYTPPPPLLPAQRRFLPEDLKERAADEDKYMATHSVQNATHTEHHMQNSSLDF